jgi:hypothetical protein
MIDDETLRGFLRELAPIQSLGADLQSVSIAPDRGGRGTPDADGKRVGQIDRGDVTKGRVAHARLSQCRSREAFAWLVEVAHCDWTLDALALHLAASHGPVEARDALVAATDAAIVARASAAAAVTVERGCRAAHGPLNASTILASHERTKADARVATAEAHAATATATLTAWGRAVVIAAWREWEAT